jgi:hypothetical protein
MPEELMCARTIYEQTGWKRPGNAPKMICQDMNVLERIFEYDYDLRNDDFMAYFRGRTGYGIYCVGITIYHYETLNHQEIFAEEFDFYTNNPHMKCDGFSAKECAQISVRINKINRGKLQDCWELFNEMPTEKQEGIWHEEVTGAKRKKEQAEKEWNEGETF